MFLEQLYRRLLSEGKEPSQQKTSAFIETESSPTWSSLPHSGHKLACWLKRINFLAEGWGRTNRQTGLPLLCSFTLIHLHSSLGKCIILFYVLSCVCLWKLGLMFTSWCWHYLLICWLWPSEVMAGCTSLITTPAGPNPKHCLMFLYRHVKLSGGFCSLSRSSAALWALLCEGSRLPFWVIQQPSERNSPGNSMRVAVLQTMWLETLEPNPARTTGPRLIWSHVFSNISCPITLSVEAHWRETFVRGLKKKGLSHLIFNC